jgi:hypothetical protein
MIVPAIILYSQRPHFASKKGNTDVSATKHLLSTSKNPYTLSPYDLFQGPEDPCSHVYG